MCFFITKHCDIQLWSRSVHPYLVLRLTQFVPSMHGKISKMRRLVENNQAFRHGLQAMHISCLSVCVNRSLFVCMRT